MSQPLQPKSPKNRNFLKFKPLKWFLQSSLYPRIFQWAAVLHADVIIEQLLQGENYNSSIHIYKEEAE